jgi:regulator of CtrA degradation
MSSDRFDADDVVFAGDDDDAVLREFMASGVLQNTYDEGMQLVEITSAYLEGPGREASRNLSRDASLTYASESMRLTTRLMQIAAWLLVRKAVHEGELSLEEGRSEKYRLSRKEIARAVRIEGTTALPVRMQELIAQSEQLYARVERLDAALRRQPERADTPRPLAEQFSRVEAFFQETFARG